MALPKPGQSKSERSIEEFLARRPNAAESAAAIAELRETVKRYEERYNLPSDRLHAAVAAGEISETLDVCDWLIHYDMLLHVEGR
jgi:hypothetical protein